MTFIQPNKNKRANTLILVALFLLLAAGSLYLIVLYNKSVNFEHGTAAAKQKLSTIEAQTTDIKNNLFTLLNASKAESVASGKLVEERSPEYVQWSYASGY